MQPTPILQKIGALSIFAAMMSLAVLYQCGVFKPQSKVDTKTQAPWFNQAAFDNEINKISRYIMPSSKSGRAIPINTVDTQTVFDILEMRYQLSKMSKQEAIQFNEIFFELNKTNTLVHDWMENPGKLQEPVIDSLRALVYVKAGPENFVKLSKEERGNVHKLLGALNRNQIYPIMDTITALRIYRTQQHLR